MPIAKPASRKICDPSAGIIAPDWEIALRSVIDAINGTGATAVAFVLKAGDVMTGPLETVLTEESGTTYGLKVMTDLGTRLSTNHLVHIEATDSNWNEPLLYIKDVSSLGAAVDLRIDSDNPDIELIDTTQDNDTGKGKYELAVGDGVFQINSRNVGNTAFETVVRIQQRQSTQDCVTIIGDSTSSTRDFLTLRNDTSSSGARPGLCWRAEGASYDMARLSASQGASSTNTKFYVQVADSSKALQERLSIDVTGRVDVGSLAITSSSTPASSSAAGTAGEIRWDSSYVYVCVATDTWRRAALSPW